MSRLDKPDDRRSIKPAFQSPFFLAEVLLSTQVLDFIIRGIDFIITPVKGSAKGLSLLWFVYQGMDNNYNNNNNNNDYHKCYTVKDTLDKSKKIAKQFSTGV